MRWPICAPITEAAAGEIVVFSGVQDFTIGDTLVEETDGPQISKYGHSHSTFFGEEEYEEGVPRHSTWVHTAFLLLGDIVGTGVLSLAAAFAGFG